MAEMKLYLRFETLKNPTLLGGTYLSSSYMGVSLGLFLSRSLGRHATLLPTNGC